MMLDGNLVSAPLLVTWSHAGDTFYLFIDKRYAREQHLAYLHHS